MSIYDDVKQAEDLIVQCIDFETGEIKDEKALAEAEKLKAQVISQGLEKLCKVHANKVAFLESLKLEITRLTEKAKRTEKEIDRVKNYIDLIFCQSNEPKQVAGSFTVSKRKSVRVVIDEDAFCDDRFLKITTNIDKMAVKKALTEGQIVENAQLQENFSIQIK